MDKRKLISFLLALTMILSLAVGASAAETTEARVPVTLTVVNTVAPILLVCRFHWSTVTS